MKRNQSARPENFRMNAKAVIPKLGISEIDKTQSLKNRLIERGLGTNPLPSVKKPRVTTSSSHRLQTVQTVQTLPTTNDNKLTLIPSTSRVSITGFTSAGALRPSSALKTSKVPTSLILRTANQPSRPCTARTNLTSITKVHTFRLEPSKTDEERVASLIEKITNRPATARKDSVFTPVPKMMEHEAEVESSVEESRLDLFIRSIRDKTAEHNQFVYLLREPVGQANDFEVVSAEVARSQENGDYFTLSAAGLSSFVAGSPVEFSSFKEFLAERKQFFSLKKVAFFQQFRVWKIVKMWERNVNRHRRNKRRKKLEEKLYSADSSYSKVLLTHRGMCLDMEKIKFVEIPGHLDQVTLKEFVDRQKAKIAEVRTVIEETGKSLRINVRQGVINIMNLLREEIVMDIAEKKNYGKLNLQMFPQVRKICPLYEKMGFPENMSYDQRADLRKECSRFIRFTYLADFVTLESLQNIYLSSVRELLLKIYEQFSQLSEDLSSDKSMILLSDQKKRNRVPLFKIELVLDRVPVDSSKKIPLKNEFVPRKSPPEDFHPNIHLNFDGENLNVPCFVVPEIQNFWLKLAPDRKTFVITLEDIIAEGLDALKNMQRWSRHPEMEDYVTALEEWDDKVADKWTVAEDIFLDVISWLEDSNYYKKIRTKLNGLIKKAFKDSKIHFQSFNYALSAYWKNLEIRFELLEKENLMQKVDSFDWTFAMFRSQKALIEKAPKLMDSGLFRIDCLKVKNFLIQNSKDSLKVSQDILLKFIRKKVESCRSWASKSARILGTKVFTVEEFVIQKVSLQEVNDQISEVKRNLDLLGYLYNLGLRSDIGLVTEDTDQYTLTMSIMTMLNGYIINIESTAAKNMAIYKKKLKNMVPQFLDEVNLMSMRIAEEKFLKIESNPEIILQELTSMQIKCKEFSENSRNLSKFQEVLGETVHVFSEVQAAAEQVDIREKLWKGFLEYEKIYTRIQYTPVKLIDFSQSTIQAEEFYKIVRRSESALQNSSVLDTLKSKVQDILELMPIVSALRAPFLETHWKMLRELLTDQFELNDSLTLNSLKKFKIKENNEEILAISVQASQEFELKAQLKAVVDLWDELEIPLQQFKEKDVYILGDIEEFVMNLEDSLAKLSLISGNRYVTPLRDEVNLWRNHLNTVQDVLDEWATLQKTWMYFSAIFSSQDIKRKLAYESQTYETVDKFYRGFMKRTNLNNNAIKIMVLEGKLLDQLKKFNTSLEVVQKNLSQYLEDKRGVFPRFYFISDDELLKVLAQAANPLSLQPFISKCFENIHQLQIGEDLKAADILAMISSEGEIVSFEGRPLKARGNVEEWLLNVQVAMCETLERSMKFCKESSEKSQFKPWVLSNYPCQAISTVASINWCIETDLTLGSIHDSPNVLKEWINTCHRNLNHLVDLVKSPVNELKRKLIVAMITTSVHNRDILANLQELEVETNSDFSWQKQLRYYWDGDICLIKQINFSCQYAYEYLGCTSRLVVTPLTEKCWITITSALNVKLGACPSGPAGTGKTESTKDLAKALGQLCIVFNCSEQITYKMTSRLFAGLIQQGAWSCLDEFNRIDIEVLSVIAQQLQTIKNALQNNMKEFQFENRKIPIRSGFGVFVTMNPGYAGRTELPDNLKVLFRPVSMMIPDYSMIAEIMLMAEGFHEASRLSKKIVQLYKLANEQLSSQFHYDFGLRALKSVLLTAGDIRRKLEETAEENILIQAMNESNIPKLVQKDVLLFKALVQDLFPGVSLPKVQNESFLELIKADLMKKGLQGPEGFIRKVFELADTMSVRYGSMLVGPAMSGKSTLIRTLSTCKGTSLSVLNPKSITIGELYGDMNHLTQDWKDGLASSIFREITNGPNPELRWVVFDGPVDSLWIESMNTVLDDNMMLCLPNGERIKLKPSMRILFEVADLSKASPATVSRCGMVYIPHDNLTWNMLATSWLEQLEGKELKEVLQNMFGNILPLVFRAFDAENDMIPSSEIHKVRCLCNILTVMLKNKPKVKYLHSVFAFACIWSLGVLLDSSKHERFSNTIRHLFAQTSPFPITDTVFEYFLDKDYVFKSWKEKIPHFEVVKGLSLSQILIPTTTTVAYTSVLKMLSTENFCSLLAGGSGVGKSAIISLHVEDLLKNQEIDLSHANFSARTSSEKTQNFIESKLERKAAGVYSASSSRKLFIFIDDVGMPGKDAFDSQPPIELLRQLIDSQGFYDRKKGFFKKISNFLIVSATGTSNLQDLSSRFMRHFHLFFISEPSSSVLLSLYSPVLSTHFEKIYPDPIRRSISTIIQSTVELYEKVVNKLKPTPSKFHYKYNLRDVGKVIQGITLATPNSLVTTDKLTKLWLHESSRVFFDRLTNPLDRVWFNKAASTTAMKYFKSGFLEDDWLETHPLQFSNIMNLDSVERIYEEIVDKKRIKRFVIDRLDDFNIRSRQKMPLEMFEEALAHVLHVCRGIYCPRGHMMLVGVGGSGKQSLAFLSSSILMFEPFSIQLIKGYNIENFHEDLKKLTRKSGVEGKPVSFVFSDQHMILDSFLEDLNSLINSGEVSDLYSEEEVEEIVNSLRSELVDHQGIEDSKETIYKEFINRVRDNLHILLCTSPVGSTLRNRCRMFPSFVNCSTIEWFDNWPEEALLSVATSKLSDLKIQIKSLANFASAIHLSAENEGLSFYKVLKRPAYVTPKLFFDFFEVFSKIFKKTSDNLWKKSTKLTNGLSKLNETRKIIAESQIKLQEMMPDLEIQKKRAENYYLEVQKETKAAVDLQVSVEKETEFIEIQFQDCKLKSDDAERDLAEATPILENALKAVQALEKNKSHIIEFKKYLKPPETIKMVMEAVCILLGERSDWNNAIVVLGQMDFLQRIVNYPKESVSNSTFKKLRIIVSKPEFQPEIVAQSSEAAKSLCIWCRAMFNYTEIFQIVKPKREKVFQMQAKLKSDMEKLESKQSELRSVEEKVNKLKDECAMTEQKVGTLEKDIKLTMDRVKRAELLLELLSEEGIKWQETVNQIQNYLKFVEVESMLNASVINYQGVFTDRFRSQLKEKTIILANHLQLPISDNYSFISTLGKPIEIREWQISGLPKDQTSQENSIIVMNSCKWPIIIDPQDQARRWLKNSFKKQNLVQLKPVKPGSKESKDVLRILESAVTSAKPVLFEDVGESQDSSLTNLLSRKFYKKDDGRLVIRLTDHEVMYDEGFFMVLQCRLSNPQFLPEVFGTLNVVNFTVTESGLEDQLLVEVVRLENPRLERERDDIIVSLAADQKLLEETQNAILDMIADSQGFILDNLNLISALQRSKSTSKDITRRVASTTQVENQVNLARDAFREIAIRGSVLFFVITSIPGINPMYQYSLAFYTKLFCSSIQSTASSSDRSSAIIENVTKTIFKVICRGLFEKDKKILAFLFAVAIWKNLKKISNETWKVFIRGAGLVAKKNAKKNPMSSVLNDLQWDFLCKLEKVSGFEGLADDFELRSREWTDFITDVLTKSPPGKYNLLDPFAKLLLVKALRPEKIMYAIDSFARAALGPFFSQVPPADLNSLFDESDKKTPIVFILSQGTDPVENILKITKDRGMSEKLVMISLGQGQGAKAQEAFDKSKAAGWWLLLQNCHLSRSWLPTLETLVDNLQEDSAGHRDFRVILTSMPSESFPVSILQNSLKVTTEPPSGLKSNISAVFSQVDTTSAEVPRPEIWKKMVFGVSFFHALTVERRKFGPLGFNIRYEFNDSDFITSIKLLKLLVEENEDVPWEGIQYIIGNINYGGRVTDKNDQVCLMAMFNKCCNAETLEENYFYTEDEVFKVPSQGDFLEYISSLPNVDPPEVFGMNINAQITLETQTSDSIIQCLIQTQPKEVSEDAADSDKMVHSMCKSLSNSLMDNMDLRAAHNDHLAVDSNGLIPSLSTFLFQEVEKFNRLLNKMRSSLKDLRNAIKGKVIMTEELSEMFSSLLNSSVPDMWKKVSYPSLKSLASWVADFNARVKFIYDWVKYGYQSCYWLSGFFFPQSFLTAVLQTHSRKYSLPIDSLVFTFEVTPWSFQEFRKNPADGVFIYGLFLEAARWDREEMILIDALEKEIYFTMPVIHFLPTNNYVAKEGDYLCPLYKTTSRAGILSSTGLSTNFVVYVDLSSEENPDKWTLLGVALLCQTND